MSLFCFSIKKQLHDINADFFFFLTKMKSQMNNHSQGCPFYARTNKPIYRHFMVSVHTFSVSPQHLPLLSSVKSQECMGFPLDSWEERLTIRKQSY